MKKILMTLALTLIVMLSLISCRTTTYPVTNGRYMTFKVNGVKFTMVRVTGGSYIMGESNPARGGAHERPAHRERVGDFMIGQTEVTQELWRAVMGSNPSEIYNPAVPYTERAQKPVNQVSWNDCQEFIKKLNDLTGQNFRLPTEAEWEYAARGGNKSEGYYYSGSNDYSRVGWLGGTFDTRMVATFQPNELGIYDMTGNVEEWTSDGYSKSYDQPRDTSRRVIRGGSFSTGQHNGHVTDRRGYEPGTRLASIGLRLAL